MISKEVSEKVLTISPYHNKRKGGIVFVVDTLSTHYEVFNFISSSNIGNIFTKIGYFINSVLKLFYYIFFRKVKIVHIHGASYQSFFRKKVYIDICSFFKVKIVYHIHGGEFHLFYEKLKEQKKSYKIEKTLDKVDTVITLSNSWKLFYDKITNPNKVIVLNNIVLPPPIKIKNSNQTHASINLLFLGDIRESKGIFDLLDVIAYHKNELTGKFCLYIAGRGEIKRLNDFINNEKLDELIKYEGWIVGKEKEELLSKSDILVLPSYNEGLPISILEAMSHGLAIIATNVGGIPEIVSTAGNGFLVSPGDKELLWKAIDHFLSNREEIDRMGQNGKKVIKNYYPESVIPELNQIYKNLL